MSGGDTATTEASVFLERFFAAPNGIVLSEIAGGRWQRVQPWVDDLLKTDPTATVLPCWRSGRVHWYALAFSDAQFSALRDDLLAFVGPTYSTFRGYREGLDAKDPVESAVLAFTGGRALSFTGPLDHDEAKPIWAALELMRSVTARRPVLDAEAPRPTGRVLRDFYMALRVGNAASAQTNLRYLVERGRLDPLNVLFLRVQAHAALGEWEALLGRPELSDLLLIRRPVAVTEALMSAVYHSELARFEAAGLVDEAVAHFQSSVLPRFGTLLTKRSGIRSAAAVKLLMLQAVVGDHPDKSARDALVASQGLAQHDRLYLRLIGDRLRALPEGVVDEPLAMAAEALASGYFDRAFELLQGEPPSVRRARGLLECAYELQSLDVERAAVTAVDALDAVARADALRGRLHLSTYNIIAGCKPDAMPGQGLPGVRPLPGEQTVPVVTGDGPVEVVPCNWIEWLERLAADPSWERAQEVARRGATEWSVEALLALPRGAGLLADRLASARGSMALQLALPHVLAFFEGDPEWPNAELAPAYLWTLEQLAIGSHGGEDDLVVFFELAQAVLAVGAGSEEYQRLVDAAEFLAGDSASYHSVGWALDLLDLMVVHSCPREDLRLRFLIRIIAQFRKYWLRLDESQWDVLRTLCDEIGQKDAFAALADTAKKGDSLETSPVDIFARLRGRSVAIYTLTERAGKRMREILEHRVVDISVHLSHEKVGSDSLRHLARHADVFIVATASAKHAATGFIDACRPKDLPTLRPAGKGTASMMRILHDYLRDSDAGDERMA